MYFAIESFNACELHDATCVDDYNLQRAFLRDHFNSFGKNNENWNVVLKFFINGKQYGKFLYHGEDLAFRDTRGLNYDSNYDPSKKLAYCKSLILYLQRQKQLLVVLMEHCLALERRRIFFTRKFSISTLLSFWILTMHTFQQKN